MTEKNRFGDKFSIKKIGSGKFYTAGSFSSRLRRGLAGALRQSQVAGRHSFAKNLSAQDLKTFQKLVGEELSKLPTHSSGLSYKTRLRIMARAEQLRRRGEISLEDKRDLRNIVQALSAQPRAQKVNDDNPAPSKPTQRAPHFISREDTEEAREIDDLQQKHIKANIAIDLTREGEAGDEVQYDPRSELGRMQAAEEKKDTNEDHPKKAAARGKKVELPDIKNLPDMDIG